MKLIVETKGDFSLSDTLGGQYIDMNRPAVIHPTRFTETKVAKGELVVLGQVADTASDADFIKHCEECTGKDGKLNKALAVESYIEMHPVKSKDEIAAEAAAAAEKAIEEAAKAQEAAEKAAAEKEEAEKKAAEEAEKKAAEEKAKAEAEAAAAAAAKKGNKKTDGK